MKSMEPYDVWNDKFGTGNYRGTLEGTSQSEFLQQIELTKQIKPLLIGP